jgi:molybdopterin converting factor small subunit
MPVVYIPALLRQFSGGRDAVRVSGSTLGEALAHLEELCPGIGAHLFETGASRKGLSGASRKGLSGASRKGLSGASRKGLSGANRDDLAGAIRPDLVVAVDSDVIVSDLSSRVAEESEIFFVLPQSGG